MERQKRLEEHFRKTLTFFVGQQFCNKYCECNRFHDNFTNFKVSKLAAVEMWRHEKTKQNIQYGCVDDDRAREKHRNTISMQPIVIPHTLTQWFVTSIAFVFGGPKTMLKCHRCVTVSHRLTGHNLSHLLSVPERWHAGLGLSSIVFMCSPFASNSQYNSIVHTLSNCFPFIFHYRSWVVIVDGTKRLHHYYGDSLDNINRLIFCRCCCFEGNKNVFPFFHSCNNGHFYCRRRTADGFRCVLLRAFRSMKNLLQ